MKRVERLKLDHFLRLHVDAGDLVDDLPALLRDAPDSVQLVVFHSAVLTYVSPDRRRAFTDVLVDGLARLDVVFARAALADRMDAIAPAVPTEAAGSGGVEGGVGGVGGVVGGFVGGVEGGVGGVGGAGAALGAAPGSSGFALASTKESGVSPAFRQPTIVTDFSSAREGSEAFLR